MSEPGNRGPGPPSSLVIALAVLAVLVLLLPGVGTARTAPQSFTLRSTLSLAPQPLFSGSVLSTYPEPTAVAWDAGTRLLDVVEANGVLAAMNATTGQAVHQTYLGGTLSGLAVDPLLDRLYVADTSRGLLDVVAGTNGALLARVPVGVGATGVAFDPLDGNVWVANSVSGNLTAVSVTTDKVVGSVPGGAGASWVAVDTRNGHLFVTNTAACAASATVCNVTVINPINASIVATIQVGNGPSQLLFNNRTDQVYVAVTNAQRVAIIGGTTNIKITSNDVGMGLVGNLVRGLGLDTITNRVYAATTFGIVEINGTNWKITNDAPVDFVPTALAFSPSLHLMFAADQGSPLGPAALIHSFVPATQSFGTTFPLYDALGHVIYNGFNHRMYVEDATLNQLDVLNASTRKLVSTIPDVLPGAMAYNPLNGSVFVIQGDSIAVFSATTNQRVELLSDPHGAIGLAYDYRDRELFAANYDDTITAYRVVTNSTVATLPVPPLPDSSQNVQGTILTILYDGPANRVFSVTSGIRDQYGDSSWNMSAIDPVALQIVASNWGLYQAGSMMVDPKDGQLYVTFMDTALSYPTDWLSVFNVSTLGYSVIPITGDVNSITSSWPAEESQGLGWAPSTGDFYVTNATGTLFRINVSNGTVDSMILGGTNPEGSVFDPVTGMLWVPNARSGTISVLVP